MYTVIERSPNELNNRLMSNHGWSNIHSDDPEATLIRQYPVTGMSHTKSVDTGYKRVFRWPYVTLLAGGEPGRFVVETPRKRDQPICQNDRIGTSRVGWYP